MTNYQCANRHCRVAVNRPGRCDTCAKMWQQTVAIAQAAYSGDIDVDEEDDYDYSDDYGWPDDREDFGADMGISVSDPLDYFD